MEQQVDASTVRATAYTEAYTYLWSIVQTLEERFGRVCGIVLHDISFQQAPASADKHHAFSGGLVVHTAAVMHAALALGDVVGANREVLATAVIWHDYGKRLDYFPKGADLGYAKTSHHEMIYHVAASYAEFYHEAADWLAGWALEAVGHCILAHHGRQEWGSPVTPKTKEAWILHSVDVLDAWYAPAGKRPKQ